jgi:hypothetical protein
MDYEGLGEIYRVCKTFRCGSSHFCFISGAAIDLFVEIEELAPLFDQCSSWGRLAHSLVRIFSRFIRTSNPASESSFPFIGPTVLILRLVAVSGYSALIIFSVSSDSLMASTKNEVRDIPTFGCTESGDEKDVDVRKFS